MDPTQGTAPHSPIIKASLSGSGDDLNSNKDPINQASSPAILAAESVTLEAVVDNTTPIKKTTEPPAIQVINPERVGDKEPFVVYTIITANSRVSRRFQDFDDFYAVLKEAYGEWIILPPLPSKNNLEFKDKFNPVFLDRRRMALERFLNRLNGHPVVKDGPQLKAFLSDQTLVLKGNNLSSSSLSTASNVATKGIGTLVDHLSDVLTGFGLLGSKPAVEERFETMKEQTKKFQGHFEKLEEHYKILYKAQKSMEEAMHSFGRELLQVQQALQKASEMVGGDSGDASCFTKLSVQYEDQANACKSFSVAMKANLIVPVHDLGKYCRNAAKALEKRDGMQSNTDELANYLAKSRAQLSELRGIPADHSDGSLLGPLVSGAKAMGSYLTDQIDRMKGVDLLTAKQQKMTQIEKRILELETGVSAARQQSEEADRVVQSEMGHFNQTVQADLSQHLIPFCCSLHSGYFEKSRLRWA